jgi:hypothetical protein
VRGDPIVALMFPLGGFIILAAFLPPLGAHRPPGAPHHSQRIPPCLGVGAHRPLQALPARAGRR